MISRSTQPADESASDCLSFISGYLYRLIRYEAQSRGIRWSALMVLKDLSLLGPQRQKTLAAIEQMREPTMTVLINQMEESGWVGRCADPIDARAKLVTITRKGKLELAWAGRILRKRMDKELEDLSQSEVEGIANGLRPLVDAVMRRINSAPGTNGGLAQCE